MIECIKSKKVVEYQKTLHTKIDVLIEQIKTLREKLKEKEYTYKSLKTEDEIQHYKETTYQILYNINIYERKLQQILAELGRYVYINVFEGNKVTPYEVIEMKTPSKWMIREEGKADIIPIYKGNKSGNFYLNKHIAVVAAEPIRKNS